MDQPFLETPVLEAGHSWELQDRFYTQGLHLWQGNEGWCSAGEGPTRWSQVPSSTESDDLPKYPAPAMEVFTTLNCSCCQPEALSLITLTW